MLVIVGLSIVAMIINVIQIRIEEWLFRVMRMIQVRQLSVIIGVFS